MVSRIYTQADYDKITDLYNEYQWKKDTYTPEQQQSIESAFWNARAQVSNRIEESKNKLVDMYNDEQWNTWWEYWDGRKEILNAAPTPTPNPNIVPQKATRRTPEIPTETPAMSDDNYYNNWMNQLREEQYTIWWKPMTETPYNPNQLQSNSLLQWTNNSNTRSIIWWQNVIPQSNIQSNSLLQWTHNPNVTPTIWGKSIIWNKPTINVQYLLKNWWTIWSDWYMVDPQWNRRSNMYVWFMYQ